MTSLAADATTPGGRTDELGNDQRRLRRARVVRRVFLGAVAIFVALGALNVFGVRTNTHTVRRGPWRLEVEYPRVNRGGLPAPFSLTITHVDGFDAPVTMRVDSAYLGMFDENGLDPDPERATSGHGYVEWSFEPPDAGDVLVVDLDARIEPGRRGAFDGWVEIIDDTGPAPRATFTTWLAP